MLELCDHILKNYPKLTNQVSRWQLLSLLDRNEDRVVIIKENEKIKGSALYLQLTDETLWQIKYGFIDLKNPETVNRMLREQGDNIHFLYVLADGVKTILRGLREVIKKENPKTVSWYNPEMTKFNKFNLKERTKCPQS